MHKAHRKYIAVKLSSSKNVAYLEVKRATRKRLKAMKNSWWEENASALQAAADTSKTKALSDGLKEISCPVIQA